MIIGGGNFGGLGAQYVQQSPMIGTGNFGQAQYVQQAPMIGTGNFGQAQYVQQAAQYTQQPAQYVQQAAQYIQQPAQYVQQQGFTNFGQAQGGINPQYAGVNNRINDLTRDKALFKREFEPLFAQVAGSAGGRLDYGGMVRLLMTASERMVGLPSSQQDLDQAEFMRFDFDGDGSLSFKEASKCFRKNMMEMQKEIGGKAVVDVPNKTPEQAGYKVIKVLASGGQGSTALADSPKGKVALKIYDKGNENAGDIEDLRGEMETMKHLESCPHIMTCIEIFQDSSHFYCVNELMPGGDLASLRENCAKNGVQLTEQYLRGIFQQCIKALAYMHKHAMMHCDIKEPNIMLKTKDYGNPSVALIDFGLTKCSAGDGASGGTPGYMPPEFFDTGGMWFPRGDIFAMGVVFFQIMADMTPDEKTQKAGLFTEGAQSMDQVEQFTRTRQAPWNRIQPQYPSVMTWLPSMLEKDLQRRPKAPALLKQPWFAQGTGSYGAQPQAQYVQQAAQYVQPAAQYVQQSPMIGQAQYVQQAAQYIQQPAQYVQW